MDTNYGNRHRFPCQGRQVAWCGQDRPSIHGRTPRYHAGSSTASGETKPTNIVFQTNMATYRHGRKSAAEMVQWYQATTSFCTSSSDPLPVLRQYCGRPLYRLRSVLYPISLPMVNGLSGHFANEGSFASCRLGRQHLVELSGENCCRDVSKYSLEN